MNRILVPVAVLVALASGRVINVPGDYPTIQQGIDAAAAADIVLVAPGVYPEEISLKAGVVVRGSGWEQTTIDGGGNAGDVVRAIGNSIGPDTRLEGFTVTGAANGGGMPGGGGVFCNSGARPDIGNCRITGNDAGVALWNGSSASVHNCLIDHNRYDAVSTGAYATVVNNTIHANRNGFYDYSGYGPVFMNNIVTGNSSYGVYGPSGGTRPALSYNDVWSNATNYRQAAPGVGSDSVDPLYVDTAALDFRLHAGSPCIDAGNPAPQYNDPDGTRNDMGAFGGPEAPSGEVALTTLVPARNELNVSFPMSALAGFNVAMDPATLSGASFKMHSQLTGWRFGPVGYDSVGQVAELDPDDELWPGELVTVELTNAVRSAGGDTFPGCLWQFTTAVGGGSGHFGVPSYVTTYHYLNWVVAADFDGDGNLDVATVSYSPDEVRVYLGQGNGRFQARCSASVWNPWALCAGDFDGDSVLDLAVSRTDDSVSLLRGHGDGRFDPGVAFPCGDGPREMSAADFNLDGCLDLAAACSDGQTVAFLAGLGDGRFAPPVQYAADEHPAGLDVGDLNQDGFCDIIVSSVGPGRRLEQNVLRVLLGRGDGTFDALAPFHAGSYPAAVRLGDFNEDGMLDAAAVDMQDSSVWIALGNGDGTFTSGGTYAVQENPLDLAVADLDADGHLDLAVVSRADSSLSVLLGRGNGQFGSARNWTTAGDPVSLTRGDFDGDGDIDIAVAGYHSGVLTVLLNEDALTAVRLEPAPHALNQPGAVPVIAQFNQQLDPRTLDSLSLRVFGAFAGRRSGEVDYDSAGMTAVFSPSRPALSGEQCHAVLTRGITAATGVQFGGFGWDWLTRPARPSSGEFGSAASFPTGTEPRGSACADFDGDGDIDILTTCNSPAAAAVLKNDGTGSFGAPRYTSLAEDPMSAYAADLNADGHIDACVLHNEPGSSRLEFLRNDGAGNLDVAAIYVPATLGQYVSGGDVDNDGDIDIVVTDGWGSQNNVKVMINNGAGGLSSPVSYSSGSWARGVVVMDVDNDGDADLCVVNQGNANVTVLYNDGSGAFPHGADFAACAGPDGIGSGDFNSDGWVDLAVTSLADSSVAVLMNNRSGGFDVPALWPAGFPTRAIVGNDLNGDGDLDLVCVGNGTDSLAVLPGNGDGTFGAAVAYATGASPWSATVADYNLDGALDVANVNYGTSTVSVRLATGVGIAAEPAAARLRLNVSPSPFASALSISLSLVPEAVRIYSAAGRLVCSLAPAFALTWDGRDADGRLLPAGVYLIRADAGKSLAAAKVVLSR